MEVGRRDAPGFSDMEYHPDELKEYFQTILDAAGEAFVLLDSDRRIILANNRFHQLLDHANGEKASMPNSYGFLVDHPDLHNPKAALPFKIGFLDSSGRRRVVAVYPHSVSVGEGHAPFMLLALTDLTGVVELRNRLQQETDACEWAKKELQESGERYRTIVESMNDGLAVRDREDVLTYVNQGLCDMLGYSADELIGRSVYDLVGRRNRAVFLEQMLKRERGMHQPYEIKWVRKDGREIEVLLSPMVLYDSGGDIAGSFALVTDISERKRIETALRDSERKLRILSNRLFMAQENEREKISRELHDQLGQDLTVLKYQMRFIEKKLRKDQKELKEACLDSLQHIDALVENTRRISRNLSPYNLRQAGLTAALQRMAEDFSKHNPFDVSVSIDKVDDTLPLDAEISIYRILQEALSNIGRHADASRALLEVRNEGEGVRCSIEDNGVGFDVARARSEIRQDSDMGLVAMEERANMIGGSLRILSRKGIGTRIVLTVPGKADEKPIDRERPGEPQKGSLLSLG